MSEAKEKTVMWIPLGIAFRGSWQCEKCGSIYQITDQNHYIARWNYCPNCGSKMEHTDARVVRRDMKKKEDA